LPRRWQFVVSSVCRLDTAAYFAFFVR
jgi:hypothetical protein